MFWKKGVSCLAFIQESIWKNRKFRIVMQNRSLSIGEGVGG
jgi:hypothetical protein